MLRDEYVAAAAELMARHADRRATGVVREPADLSAIVAVERLSQALGTTDAHELAAAVAGTADGWSRAAEDESLDAGPSATPRMMLVRDLLEAVSHAVMLRDTGASADAAVLNAEAGGHPVATDAVVVRAAARAAHRSFHRVPYYAARYGARGARFATSDSGWLVTLAGLGEEAALRHVRWLGTTLAARGMPTWLLELHLQELVDELRNEHRPEGGLPSALEQLSAQRRTRVDDALLEQAEDWVQARVAAPPVAGAGRLVAAGVADVLVGHVGNDGALMRWMIAPERVTQDDAGALLRVRDDVLAAARPG